MKKFNSALWSTSALVPIGYVPNNHFNNTSYLRSSGRNTISGSTFENCGTGIMISQRHRCPSLSLENLREIANDEPEFVTRHIESCYFEAGKNGYFQLGTLMRYRAKEEVISGRLGDHEESRQQEIFNSRTNYFKSLQAGSFDISDSHFSNTQRHIVIETTVNDYCSCSSVGKFDANRGQKLKDAEIDPDKKPGAYITYHLPTLKNALKDRVSKEYPHLSSLEPLGRKVQYGQKDRKWDVEENFKYSSDADAVAIWLGIAFVKSPKFSHEDEYRLLFVNPNNPGGLDEKAETTVISEDQGIAAAITESSYY